MEKKTPVLDYLKSTNKPPIEIYPSNTLPFGLLVPIINCQALFNYYLTASQLMEKEKLVSHQPIEIYMSICMEYRIEMNSTKNHWPAVDAEVLRLNLPLLPVTKKFRFINTEFVELDGGIGMLEVQIRPSKKSKMH